MKYHIEKNTVQETLVIPLYGRKMCSELYPNLFRDETAVRLINEIDYDFSTLARKSQSMMQQFGFLECAMRQSDLACEVRDYLRSHPNAAVVNLGCGLDATGHACDNGTCKIYNLDFPDVIAVRDALLPALEREKNIPCNLNNTSWFREIDASGGAVFFAGCPLGCVYCQNYALSRGRIGETVSVERLAAIFAGLEAKGVHNLNLVTGTQFTPEIREALTIAKPKIPVVWNTSGYETVGTVDTLAPQVSVFLPDLKYTDPALAARYSRAPDYPAAAKRAIKRMVEHTGAFELDENGLLRRGVMIRHLVLPGQIENTRAALFWIADTFAPGTVLVSLMAQYTPCGDLKKFPELRRTLTPEEWDAALSALDETGLSDGYAQELSASGEEEIPAFDGTGVIS